jgi:hypothetical protein
MAQLVQNGLFDCLLNLPERVRAGLACIVVHQVANEVRKGGPSEAFGDLGRRILEVREACTFVPS